MSTHAPEASSDDSDQPLFVDLDGTLVRTDLLWEALCLLARTHPAKALAAPFWVLSGKARFKARVAALVQPDAALLPYRTSVIEYVEHERAKGRRVVLASASPDAWVRAVSDHLGVFDDVIATTEEANRAGAEKLESIRAMAPNGQFEYLGNSSADIPIWQAASRIGLVAPSRAARRGVAPLGQPVQLHEKSAPLLPEILRTLRPHQWAKNALLFMPILLAHEVANLERFIDVFVAFAGFCAAASTGYVLNDLVDVEADRQHPSKCRRPLASGGLPVPVALVVMAMLSLFAFGSSALVLSAASTGMLACYLALTLSYSFYFKQRLLLDVLMLAGLYTHRVLSGGVAASVTVSPWLLAFSTFFFLSLALVKRYVELRGVEDGNQTSIHGRAYQPDDWPLVETMGLVCAYISVLVLCLFVSSDNVSKLYRTPELLWLLSPVMLYWISRIWFLAHRGQLDADPVLFATRDRNSYVAGGLMFAIVVAAAW